MSKLSPLPEAPYALPDAFSRYLPIARIGSGGMAEVILAEMNLGRGATRLAVLKRIWPHLAADPDFVPMFIHEGRVSVRMNHPNVVQTYEVVEDAKRPAIAMEYLDGQPLHKVLGRLVKSDTLSIGLRLRIIMNLLAGLEYTHDLADGEGTPHHIVHRDVSPQNVFVTYGGQVKLLDFGVAKSVLGVDQTRPGSIKGRLAYMAPEQMRGEIVDRRADIFAVGVMLWEMISARRLWQGMPEPVVIRHLCSRTPLPPVVPSLVGLPRGIERICARALAIDPNLRYATAAEFESELARLLPPGEDVKGRRLGKVISLAFAEERSARRSLIESHRDRRSSVASPSHAWLPDLEPTANDTARTSVDVVEVVDPRKRDRGSEGERDREGEGEGDRDGDREIALPHRRPRVRWVGISLGAAALVSAAGLLAMLSMQGRFASRPVASIAPGAVPFAARERPPSGAVEVRPIVSLPSEPPRTVPAAALAASPPRPAPRRASLNDIAERATLLWLLRRELRGAADNSANQAPAQPAARDASPLPSLGLTDGSGFVSPGKHAPRPIEVRNPYQR